MSAAAREGIPPVLWRPSAQRRERANLTAYGRWLTQERGLALADYDTLWTWSVTDLDGFWGSLWDYFEVVSPTGYERVLGSRSMPGAEWFPGAQVNYAEHLLTGAPGEREAIVHRSESRPGGTVSWGELRELVRKVAGGLRALGVGPGDRVVAYLPNLPEAVAGLLACASLGAVWSSCSPEFGVGAVADRFAQIEPKVLLGVDGYTYGGRRHDRLGALAELKRRMPSLERTVVLGLLDDAPDLSGLTRASRWDELLETGTDAELAFAPVAFEHPLWVLYSSGTTGLPKAIVQGHGGILLEHLKVLSLHVDLRAGDRMFWFTTTGWMMWNFLVGALLTPASIVLYDGSPAHPSLDRLWDLAEETGITCFGTSAGYLGACLKAGVAPRGGGRALSRLEAVGSTGSPLGPEGFRWVCDVLGPETWLFSTSGGTDLCTAFVGGCPLLPVHEGELQCRALGAKIEAYDPDGHAVLDHVGELVITEPMPSMPLRLWNDPDGERYRESYFSVYPGVWRHGDWIEITARGTAVISGRSDSTINRGGVRMGTSELYRVVLAVPEVLDALVVDLPRGGEGRMVLFVVLRDDAALDDALAGALRRRIREECSPRHVPDDLRAVAAVPRTLSGKLLEVPVKRILMGVPPEEAASRDSLANPAALDAFVALRDVLAPQ